jgi:hypothetical protein
MKTQTTTYQRAIAQAKKLQPNVLKLEDYPIYIVDSTSELNIDYQVELGENKFNPFLGARCDCKGPSNLPCIHIAAAFLQYNSNLEERLWKGCEIITQAEDMKTEPEEVILSMTDLFVDLLERYENNCKLLKAIEAGTDISNFRGPIKTLLPTSEDNQQQLLTA